MLHSRSPKNIIKFRFSIAVMIQADSYNRNVVASNLKSQAIIDITLETDTKVIAGKYHSTAFHGRPVKVTLVNSPPS